MPSPSSQKHIVYLRAADGTIERMPAAIYNAEADSKGPYLYEEALVGWPEPRVYWAKETGPSTGIAPLS
ncbi:hypothetical protein SAMN05216308_10193 [Nitrosospira sp. Nsp13]|jgi:hypothetical protein|nr:hypothetical protein SAMN05216308_10193 [Nitrosospira sp. Nsp13]